MFSKGKMVNLISQIKIGHFGRLDPKRKWDI